MGSIRKIRMYPLDFEEFLWASGVDSFFIDALKDKPRKLEALEEHLHNKVVDLFL